MSATARQTTRWTLGLTALAVAAGLSYALLDPGGDADEAQQAVEDRLASQNGALETGEPRAPLFPGWSAANLTRVERYDHGDLAFAIERTANGWTQTHPVRGPLDPTAVSAWLHDLLSVQGEPATESPSAAPTAHWRLASGSDQIQIGWRPDSANAVTPALTDETAIRLSTQALERLTSPAVDALRPAALSPPDLL
ncbi:MAG: hypothetical protein AAGA57_10250, partial [Planctomycetota bacterium]